MTDRFAVMGNPIAHSLSPIIHQQFAAQTGQTIIYEKRLILPDEFEQQAHDFFKNGGKGLNITLPYKFEAFSLCQQLTERAKKAQAVNTLWMSGGKLHGDNTDGIGLLRDLQRYLDVRTQSILVLGAGGAASGVIPALLSQTPHVTLVNRTQRKAEQLKTRFPNLTILDYDALNLSSDFNSEASHELTVRSRKSEEIGFTYDLLINATSASLLDEPLPIPKSIWKAKPFCYDLAYQLGEDTSFVQAAKKEGCHAVDGLGMLVEQAAESFFIWFGIQPEVQPVLASLKKSRDHSLRS
ncbi:shikimate dehydrogenase [Legionella impletisoli]|uniref:Shikimate dehydrogenase (NADP(+)) n=1 Tax=Legionella impletisoli TaxID=343510 RepID=A0A917NBG1_9GAMM|nr:shikimate dehydrogenase [Legionella impletisoli]GGI84382.1 shikimate dehydrogenase (NADP(+)) [Legionella impletisoli]